MAFCIPSMNASAKEWGLRLARWSGAMAWARAGSRSCARVLAYHGVDPVDDPVVNFDGFQVHPDRFRRHLEVIGRSFNVQPLADLLRSYAAGSGPPPLSVALTFDDGYRNNVTHAAPLLKEYGFPATFFVTTGFLDGTHAPWWYRLRSSVAHTKSSELRTPAGDLLPLGSTQARQRAIRRLEEELKSLPRENMEEQLLYIEEQLAAEGEQPFPLMDWDDARRLRDMGYEVAPHTVSHISLGRESLARVEEELANSIQRVRDELGVDVLSYSYPYGGSSDVGANVARVLQQEGMLGSVTTEEGLIDTKTDIWGIRRINVTGRHTPLALEARLSGLVRLGRARSR